MKMWDPDWITQKYPTLVARTDVKALLDAYKAHLATHNNEYRANCATCAQLFYPIETAINLA